jgi:hypothetical protein
MNLTTYTRTAAIVASIFCAFITIGMSVAPAVGPAATYLA